MKTRHLILAGAFLLLFCAAILQSFVNHCGNAGNVIHFEGATFWQFANPVTNQETNTQKNQLKNLEDALIDSIPTVIGGFIAGIAGFFSGYWSDKRKLKRESQVRLGEFKGMLGRWNAACKNQTPEELLAKHFYYTESLWGYCARFNADFSDFKKVKSLCSQVAEASKNVVKNKDGINFLSEKIEEINALL